MVLGVVFAHTAAVPWMAKWAARGLHEAGEYLEPPAAAAVHGAASSTESPRQHGDRAIADDGDGSADVAEMTDDTAATSPVVPPSARGSAPAGRNRRAPKRESAASAAHPVDGHSIYVTRQTVERLLRARVNPSGHAVAASSDHPAGVEVTNPDGLRRLARAGDLIVDVEGRPTPTLEDLIAAVGAAQQRHASRVSGHVLRDGVRWSVTVETPW